MGGTLWSDAHYKNRAEKLRRKNRSAFGYDEDIREGRQTAGVHPLLDPKNFTDGVREARDSDAHSASTPIVVLFDVTGSMGTVPRIVQKRLCSLMGLCMRRGFIDDPAILVGGIGDATCDIAPVQIGQFESGNEIENDLSNLYLEGGGGGQQTESYELGLYFLARKTASDHLEKRGRKGYAFIIGDEMPYPRVSKREVRRVFGDRIPRDIPLQDIVDEASEKFEIYSILPNMTAYYEDARILNCWREMFGQNALRLPDPDGISELIASVIGLAEEAVDWSDLPSSLKREGAGRQVVKAVKQTLADRGW